MAGKRVANPTVGQLHYKMAHTSDGRDAGALAHYQPLTCNDSELGWRSCGLWNKFVLIQHRESMGIGGQATKVGG